MTQHNYLSSVVYSFRASPICATTTHSLSLQTIHYMVRFDLKITLTLTSSDNTWEFTFLWDCPVGNASSGHSNYVRSLLLHLQSIATPTARSMQPRRDLQLVCISYSHGWIMGDAPWTVDILWSNPNLCVHFTKKRKRQQKWNTSTRFWAL